MQINTVERLFSFSFSSNRKLSFFLIGVDRCDSFCKLSSDYREEKDKNLNITSSAQ